MKIHAIHINHLLSFDDFVWEELDPHLNVIVGPNGVGKTNLFRALQAVRDALSSARGEATMRWIDSGHRGTNADTLTVTLDLQFTTEWEQRLLSAFLAALLCNQQEIQQINQNTPDPKSLRRFAVWIQEHLHPEDFSWLFSGRLTVMLAGRVGWVCQYEAHPGEQGFRLDLTSGGALFGHAEHSSQITMQNWGSLFAAWRTSLTADERERLDQGLTGNTAPGMDFPVPDFSRLPDWVSNQQGISLQLESQMYIIDPATLATYRAFVSTAQVPLKPEESFVMRTVFRHLLDQALVFTDNVRLQPQYFFTAKDLIMRTPDLSSGEQLARFLFFKKNGRSPNDNKQYDAIQNLFSRMTGRSFNIVMGTTDSAETQQEEPMIPLELVISNSWGYMPLEFSGAGIAEALFLSAILAGSTGQVILLDEPALNLHPTMQTTLLNELQTLMHLPEGKGNQFLMSTHTPSLVPPDAIDRVSRFTLQDGHTIRQALRVSQNDLIKLRQLLRGNLAARAFLFSRAVLLVEGETELGALPVWYPDLARQDIALYAVGGRGAFVSPLKLIQPFAIPWAIIGDGEVLWDLHEQKSRQGPQGQVSRILAACNQPLPSISGNPGSNAEDFVQWRQTLEVCGIFTLASSAREGFEMAVRTEIPPELWTCAEAEFSSNKVALGRFIAENYPCPGKVADLLQRVLGHLYKQDTGGIHIPDSD